MHPHVVSLYAAWKDAQHVYLALECARGGNLLESLLSYKEGYAPEDTVAKKVAKPLLMALAHMHSQGIIHRWVDRPCGVWSMWRAGLKIADGIAENQQWTSANCQTCS